MLLPDIVGPEAMTATENKPHKESQVNYQREWDDDYIRQDVKYEKKRMYTFQCAMSAVTVTKENHVIIGMRSEKTLSYVFSFLYILLMFLAF